MKSVELVIQESDTGVWCCQLYGTCYYAPTAADAILEALESQGLDRMNSYLKNLRAKTDKLQADNDLRQADYAGLMAFVEELKNLVRATLDAAGDEAETKARTTYLRKLITPWPPTKSSRLN
jgi:hypothetical protein